MSPRPIVPDRGRSIGHSSGDPASLPAFFSPQVLEARRFYLDLKPPKERNLSIVSGGCEHCTPDYTIQRATFPYYSIEFVSRGRGSARLDGNLHTLQPGTVFSYGPGVSQQIRSDPADPLVKYFVDFTGKQARELLALAQLHPGGISQVSPPGEPQTIFDELIRTGQRGTRYTAGICASLLECLALKIAESQTPLGATQGLSFTTYQQCREHIRARFLTLKTLRQIATECHIDAAYLCRLFRRYDHQSPYQYLLRLKMNQAADWLRQPGAMVKQVSEQAGFSDPFHFSRAFKAVFGVSPDTFRRLR